MKKFFLTILSLSLVLFACTKNTDTSSKVAVQKTAPVVNEVAKNNLTLKFSNLEENLPDYLSIRSKNMYENALIIYTEKDRGSYIIAREISAFIKKTYNLDSTIIKDMDVAKVDLIEKNLFVIGNTKNNHLLTIMEPYLPAVADGNVVKLGEKSYKGSNYGLTYFYPNLYNLNNSMVLIMGNSETALKIYDFKKYDILVSTGLEQILPFNPREVAFAKFSKDWKISEIREITKNELKTGEEDKIIVGKPDHTPFPEWARGNIIYQIFPRSFYSSEGGKIGNLKGIKDKLDYIQSLGTDIIWLTPIFESPSYHGYDTSNYFNINPEYGTIDDFRELAIAVHERGMKIILDIALNHCSNKEAKFMDAYNNPDSKYSKWFYFSNIQNNIFHSWDFRHNIQERDVTNADLIAWNINNPDVIDYHVEILKFWTDPNNDGDKSDGVDGYRLDYVKGPPHEYWKVIRKKVKEIDPNMLLLGEIWLDLDKMAGYFDSEMDAAFDFSLQGVMSSKISREINESIIQHENILPENAVMARFLSNHDMTRLPTNMELNELKLYFTMAYTLKGMPTIYYGDEIGQKGERDHGDKDLRKPFEWYKNNDGFGQTTWTTPYNKKPDGVSVEEQENVDGSLLEFVKKIGKIKKDYFNIIEFGNIELLKAYTVTNGVERSSGKTIAYTLKKDSEEMIVILNLWQDNQNVRIDFTDKLVGKSFKEVLNNKEGLIIKENKLDLVLEPYTPYIYYKK
ncbi:MAG: hypothetical protein GX287_02475 [Fusobacteria bacterium]|nr:hypothetical protein [Fusobacteriota bacterium]